MICRGSKKRFFFLGVLTFLGCLAHFSAWSESDSERTLAGFTKWVEKHDLHANPNIWIKYRQTIQVSGDSSDEANKYETRTIHFFQKGDSQDVRCGWSIYRSKTEADKMPASDDVGHLQFVKTDKGACLFTGRDLPEEGSKKPLLEIAKESEKLPRTAPLLLAEMGGMNGNLDRDVPILTVLANSDLSVQTVESQDAAASHVLLCGKGPHGKYTLRLDPNKGFAPVCLEAVKADGDLFEGKPVRRSTPGQKFPSGSLREYRIKVDNFQYKEENGDFFPIKCRIIQTYTWESGTGEIYEKNVERTSIDFKPDFKAQKAFEIDAPDGTPVRDYDNPGKFSEWRGGKLCAISDPRILKELSEMGKL